MRSKKFLAVSFLIILLTGCEAVDNAMARMQAMAEQIRSEVNADAQRMMDDMQQRFSEVGNALLNNAQDKAQNLMNGIVTKILTISSSPTLKNSLGQILKGALAGALSSGDLAKAISDPKMASALAGTFQTVMQKVIGGNGSISGLIQGVESDIKTALTGASGSSGGSSAGSSKSGQVVGLNPGANSNSGGSKVSGSTSAPSTGSNGQVEYPHKTTKGFADDELDKRFFEKIHQKKAVPPIAKPLEGNPQVLVLGVSGK